MSSAAKRFHHPEKAEPRDQPIVVFNDSTPVRITHRMPKEPRLNNLWFAIEYGASGDELWLDEYHAQLLILELAKGLAKLDEFKRTQAAAAASV